MRLIFRSPGAPLVYSIIIIYVNSIMFVRSEHSGRDWQVSWRGRRCSTDPVRCILRRETQRRGRTCLHFRLSGSQQSLWPVHRHLSPGLSALLYRVNFRSVFFASGTDLIATGTHLVLLLVLLVVPTVFENAKDSVVSNRIGFPGRHVTLFGGKGFLGRGREHCGGSCP